MESLFTQAGAPASRRDFFKRAGAGVGVLAAASALQACDSEDNNVTPGTNVELDFSSDVGVLNYAYALEQLEAAFYARVISESSFGSIFNTDEQATLRDIAAHEAVHADFFRTAITAAAPSQIIPGLTPDFSEVNFGVRGTVLSLARTFEDLGVSAYNGAGKYITNKDYLVIAGKIVSVEARHASIISGLITPNAVASPGQLDANALDKSNTPRFVVTQANAYIMETLSIKSGTGN